MTVHYISQTEITAEKYISWANNPIGKKAIKKKKQRNLISIMGIMISVVGGGFCLKMGYTDYYLIVWDFINYARENGIPVGPGRGSGAGSLVAFLIGITDVDPIKFDLLFERFLNPERVSMPDFDIDFCYVNRQKVIESGLRPGLFSFDRVRFHPFSHPYIRKGSTQYDYCQ